MAISCGKAAPVGCLWGQVLWDPMPSVMLCPLLPFGAAGMVSTSSGGSGDLVFTPPMPEGQKTVICGCPGRNEKATCSHGIHMTMAHVVCG